ncbi:MAG: restriction endonuclease subunit S [Bacteroidales bacterium]|nr:restriction endonuclease subunit S [Bacteroidales bacterium]
MSFKKVKVGDFLIRIKDTIPIIDSEEYKLVTIRLYHKGVQLRKIVKGSEMQADRMSRIKAGQFILSGIDARNGAFGIVPFELDGAVVTNDFWHFEIDKNIITNEYFLWLTSTPYFDDICNKASDGTTNRIRLQADRFFSQELMIPEIHDQHKVVEKLKYTNAKIKQLEEEYNFQLTQLENLNQAILQEAVQGKLVKQDKKDEPASELLKRIKAEKVKSGKKEKPLPPIKPEELKIGGSQIPFEIPESWAWCRLGDAVTLNPRNKANDSLETGFIPMPLVSAEFGTTPLFEKRKWEVIKNGFTHFANGDVVLAKITPCFENSKAGIISGLPNGIGAGTTELHVIRGNEYVNAGFIYYFVKRVFFLKNGEKIMRGVAGQKRVPIDYVENVLFPLPPLSEQTRIVAEIEKQLAKTKQLKRTYTIQPTSHRTTAKSVVAWGV